MSDEMTVRPDKWSRPIDMTHDPQFEEAHPFTHGRSNFRVPENVLVFWIRDWAVVIDPWPGHLDPSWKVSLGCFIEPVEAPLFRVARPKTTDVGDLERRVQRLEQALAIDAKLDFERRPPAVVARAGESITAAVSASGSGQLFVGREITLLVSGRLRREVR